MILVMKAKRVFVTSSMFLLLILLVACGVATPVPTAIVEKMPTFTVTPAPTSTLIPATEFSTPLPPQPSIAFITPDAVQVERWREYQTELARVILAANPEIGNDPKIYKTALCEWDILGRSGQEVYVYGVCVGVTAKGNRDMRKPAIIYLEPDGSIQKVKIPEPKESNSEMYDYEPFPKDVQEKFCYYFDPFPSDLPQCLYPYLGWSPRPRVDEMYAHIKYRKEHPEEPPLAVLSETPTRTPTPLPPQPTIAFITPDANQVERWKEYEAALAKVLFPSSFIPGEFLCEWEILGRSDKKVYVWAVCMSIFPVGSTGLPYQGSIPAVIHIETDGSLQSVEIPGGGTNYASDIRRMFPPYAQERYFEGLIHFQELTDHLKWRREHPEEPPLIVLNANPTP